MNWKRFVSIGFKTLFALALCLGMIQSTVWGAFRSAAASSLQSVPQSVHLHGQIRDTGGSPRQGLVVISTYLGPDITQGVSTLDGFYEFDVPTLDHYVVTVFPIQRATLGNTEVPVGFLDKWERINRTTESDLLLDIIVKPSGSILLDAYDPQGNRVFLSDFPHQSMFVIYALGDPPVTDPLNVVNHQRLLLPGWETGSGGMMYPAVLMLSSQESTPFTVWGLWTVPEAGTIMLEMDNGGLGYSVAEGETKTINIVYEIAHTELRKAQEKYTLKVSAGYVFSDSISLWLTQAQAALGTAQAQLEAGDGKGAAMSAYQALTLTIRAKETIALEVAHQDIENRRQPVTINVFGADQQPLVSVQVSYQQSNHDFILSGSWGGNGAPVGDTADTRRTVGSANFYAEIAKEIGFEYLNFPPYPSWGSVQREYPSVPYRFDDDVILHKMEELGFRTTGNSIWFVSSPLFYPAFIEGLTYPEIKTAALTFLQTTGTHYAGEIQVWNVMNEPNRMNGLDFTSFEMLDFTKAVVEEAKAADPEASVLVVLGGPGLADFGGGPGDETINADSTFNYSTYDYLNEMIDAGIRPDAVGIQFYNGATLPAIDLGTVSDLLDLYGSDFELPFYIEELEYPTHEDYPGLVNLSSFWGWHQGHTDQAQADWAVGMFTLAFSKSYIIGANWSMSTDIPADRVEDGRAGDGYMHRDGLAPRPMAYALGDLFQSWTVSGTAQSGTDGQIQFDGFSGEYLLTLTAPNGAVYQETIHVRDGQENTYTIVFDPSQALNDNRQSAEVSLDDTSSALAWAEQIGKTSGVTEARSLYSQAQAAFAAGQFWNSVVISQMAGDALAIKIDGEAGDWFGVQPLYTQTDSQGQANNNELRNFYGTMDASSLVMQFKFNTTTPQREFLFELDTGADGILDYAVTASPLTSDTLFFPEAYAGDPAYIFAHLIPSINVVYGSTVEVRIPLADLGNPDLVELVLYREDLGDGTPSGVIPSLGVMKSAPGRISFHSIVVIPGSVSLPSGGTQQFTARAYDVNKNEVAIEPVWTTSSGTISSDGLYMAGAAGDFTVTASVLGSYVTGTANGEVSQPTRLPWAWFLGGLLALAALGGAGYLRYRNKKPANG